MVSFTSLSSSSSVSLVLAAIILSTMSLSVTASVEITVRRSGHSPQTAHEGGARLGECHLLGLLHRYQENRYAHWWRLLLNRRGEAVFNGLLCDSVPDLVSPFEGLLMLHDDEL